MNDRISLLTLHMRTATITIVARIIIVYIADGIYSCRTSINQFTQVQLVWVCC